MGTGHTYDRKHGRVVSVCVWGQIQLPGTAVEVESLS